MNNLFKRFTNTLGVSPKFSSDLIYNLVSFAVMSLVGILLNVIITNSYGSAGLGVFNQVYALYLFLSQLAVGGVHLSVLKYVAQYEAKQDERRVIFTSGLLLTGVIALLVVLLIYPLSGPIGDLFKSPAISTGVIAMLPGLFFFSLNKVFLALANARRQMKTFAIFQAVRYIFMLLSLVILIATGASGDSLPALFTWAELGLFALLFLFFFKEVRIRFDKEQRKWYKEHWNFGLKAMGGNLMLNTFNKIDILILGLFVGDAAVGIYSFASMLVEGFNQLAVVVRNIINPVITTTFYQGGVEALQQLTRKVRRFSSLILMPLGLIVVGGFSVLFFFLEKDFVLQAWLVFAILMAGAISCQGYQPLSMILNQTGFPGRQTMLIAAIYFTAVILNFILAPMFGLYGTAFATAITYASQIIYIKLFTEKTIKAKI